MQDTPRKRRWWIAGLLSLLVPGLGQLYNGEALKAFSFAFTFGFPLIPAVLLFIVAVLKVPAPFNICLAVLAALYVHADAIYNAFRQRKTFRAKAYNKWYTYIGYVCAFVLIFLSIQKYVCSPYKIASIGMDDTILPADRILVHKYHYVPHPGDIIIFKIDEYKHDMISRCIARGGDSVQIKNWDVYVNGEKLEERYAKKGNSGQTNSVDDQKANYGPVTIPSGCFFYLGDNRNQGINSMKMGLGYEKHVIGHFKMIYYSNDPSSGQIRWSRLGKYLE